MKEKRWDISEAEKTDGTGVGRLWGDKYNKVRGYSDARPAMGR